MLNSADRLAGEKARSKEANRASQRAETATTVSGLKAAVGPDEQLLAFARGTVAGGFKGRLSVGPEAFFVPDVNIGLTETRLFLQHVNSETGRAGDIAPHNFAVTDIQAIVCTDIETFGSEPAARIVLQLDREQSIRLRVKGANNCEGARALAEVFRSITRSTRQATAPTHYVCAACSQVVDTPVKFCPYCGAPQIGPDSGTAPTDPAESSVPAPGDMDVAPTIIDDYVSVTTTAEIIEPVGTVAETELPVETTESVDFAAIINPEEPAAAIDIVAPCESGVEVEVSFAVAGHSIDSVEITETRAPEDAIDLAPADESRAEEEVSFAAVAEPDDLSYETVEGANEAAIDPGAPDEIAPEDEISFAVEDPGEAHVSDDAQMNTIGAEQSDKDDIEPAEVSFVAVTPDADEANLSEPLPVSGLDDEFFDGKSLAETTGVEAASEVDPGVEAAITQGTDSVALNTKENIPAASFEPEATVEAPIVPPMPNENVPSDHDALVPPELHEPSTEPDIIETLDSAPADEAATNISGAESSFHLEAADTAEPAIEEPPVDNVAPLETPKPEEKVRAFEPQTTTLPQDNRPLRVHFHVQHPLVHFNQLVTGANADEVVSNLKSKVIAELKFPIKLAVMRMTTLEFAQEIVLRYNQTEKHNLPRPASCREFLTLAEAIGYATVQSS